MTRTMPRPALVTTVITSINPRKSSGQGRMSREAEVGELNAVKESVEPAW